MPTYGSEKTRNGVKLLEIQTVKRGFFQFAFGITRMHGVGVLKIDS